MSRSDEHSPDVLAALAVGALPAAAVEPALAHLAACPPCRAEYRSLAGAVGVLAQTHDEAAVLTAGASAKLKERILRAALAARPAASSGAGVARVVPLDELVNFAPGIDWAVVPAPGVTLVYWVFDPPACGEIPAERHAFTQAGFVLQGAVTLHYGNGSSQTMQRGDIYSIDPETTHGATFQERTILFDVYAPKNAQYEQLYAAMRARRRA